MSTIHRGSSTANFNPTEYARQQREKINRAKTIRAERSEGSSELDENYTFTPKLSRLGNESSSKLPAGAVVGRRASGTSSHSGGESSRRGSYNLDDPTVMANAYPDGKPYMAKGGGSGGTSRTTAGSNGAGNVMSAADSLEMFASAGGMRMPKHGSANSFGYAEQAPAMDGMVGIAGPGAGAGGGSGGDDSLSNEVARSQVRARGGSMNARRSSSSTGNSSSITNTITGGILASRIQNPQQHPYAQSPQPFGATVSKSKVKPQFKPEWNSETTIDDGEGVLMPAGAGVGGGGDDDDDKNMSSSGYSGKYATSRRGSAKGQEKQQWKNQRLNGHIDDGGDDDDGNGRGESGDGRQSDKDGKIGYGNGNGSQNGYAKSNSSNTSDDKRWQHKHTRKLPWADDNDDENDDDYGGDSRNGDGSTATTICNGYDETPVKDRGKMFASTAPLNGYAAIHGRRSVGGGAGAGDLSRRDWTDDGDHDSDGSSRQEMKRSLSTLKKKMGDRRRTVRSQSAAPGDGQRASEENNPLGGGWKDAAPAVKSAIPQRRAAGLEGGQQQTLAASQGETNGVNMRTQRKALIREKRGVAGGGGGAPPRRPSVNFADDDNDVGDARAGGGGRGVGQFGERSDVVMPRSDVAGAKNRMKGQSQRESDRRIRPQDRGGRGSCGGGDGEKGSIGESLRRESGGGCSGGGDGGGGGGKYTNRYPPFGMQERKGGFRSGGIDGREPEEAEEADMEERIECKDCGRKFSPQALARHAKICKKVFIEKRTVFNTQNMRVAGTEAATYVLSKGKGRGGGAKGGGGGGKPAINGRGSVGSGGTSHENQPVGKGKSAVPKWKRESESFREAIRQSRMTTQALKEGKSLKDLPPPSFTAEADPSLIPCKNCGRTFKDDVHARHEPKCTAKPNHRLLKGTRTGLGVAARKKESGSGRGRMR